MYTAYDYYLIVSDGDDDRLSRIRSKCDKEMSIVQSKPLEAEIASTATLLFKQLGLQRARGTYLTRGDDDYANRQVYVVWPKLGRGDKNEKSFHRGGLH